jgi:hypothetical protein
MEDFAFRGMDNPDNYFDDEFRRFTSNHRSALNSIAIALLDEDEIEKASEILNFGIAKMRNEGIAYDLASGQSVPLLFEVGEDEKALDIVEKMTVKSIQLLEFYAKTNREYDREAMISLEMLRYFVPLLEEKGYNDLAAELKRDLERFVGTSESNRLDRR